MDRRQFGKALGLLSTFSLLPEIQIVKPGITLETMQEFCMPWRERHYKFGEVISSPFVQRELASATDGRIGIRLSDSFGLADQDSELRIPPLDGAFDKYWSASVVQSWHPWPDADYFTRKYHGCPVCRGAGHIGPKVDFCDDCDGEGFIAKYDPLTDVFCGGFDCKSCNGQGIDPGSGTPCPCRRQDVPNMQHLDSRMIFAGYHRLISKLPDAEYIHMPGRNNSSEVPIMFRFSGGQGLLMPMNKDLDDE